mgnify:CR=1 FL=1
MVRRAVFLLTAFVSFGSLIAAQAPTAPPAPGARGGGRGGPAYVSPEVGADKSITFRLLAPNAQQVTVNGELDGKPYPMTKGEGGIWFVFDEPAATEIYTYSFNVDGVTSLDPRNPNTKYGYGNFGAVSVVEATYLGASFKATPMGCARIWPIDPQEPANNS